MSYVYGYIMLDPLVLAGYTFVNWYLSKATVTVETNDATLTFPAAVDFIFRSGYVGTAIMRASLTLPVELFATGRLMLNSITFTLYTTTGHAIAVTIYARTAIGQPGQYILIYATCVKSVEPILLVRE